MSPLLGLIDHVPDLAHVAVGARHGDLRIEALQEPSGRVWTRDTLQAGLASLPRDAALPARVPPDLPQPGPTGHGLASLSLAVGAARALVACPETRRNGGDWDFDVAGVQRSLAFVTERAGSAALVLLLPWEWHTGPGDGSHVLAAALAALACRPGTVLVAPTGNHGGRTALWSLDVPTRVDWTPAGSQTLQVWSRGGDCEFSVDGALMPVRPRHGWNLVELTATEPVSLQLRPAVGCEVRLRPPFPSTGALRIVPPAASLGSVGFPACHPDVVAVGADHWTSARGLGGPDVLAPWSANAAVREVPAEPCDLFGIRRGTSVAAAVHAGRLLAALGNPEAGWVDYPR